MLAVARFEKSAFALQRAYHAALIRCRQAEAQEVLDLSAYLLLRSHLHLVGAPMQAEA